MLNGPAGRQRRHMPESSLATHGSSEVFHRMSQTVKEWAAEGGVRMTDDELRGALTALAMLWRRASACGLGSKFLEMLGESGAILTKINRDRELTADYEAAILQVLEAIAEPEPEPAPETGEDPSL